jgi:hypothetical protein
MSEADATDFLECYVEMNGGKNSETKKRVVSRRNKQPQSE